MLKKTKPIRKLRDCPHCHAKQDDLVKLSPARFDVSRALVVEDYEEYKTPSFVRCHKCGATGPHGKTYSEAMRKWGYK